MLLHAAILTPLLTPPSPQDPSPLRFPPNIVLIVADDLGYGDLGCYGQRVIRTPRLDRMATEGMRFTQFYAGCTVCAPSRSVLMTGLHGGHTHVRGNAGGDLSIQALRDKDVTMAEVLKAAGYVTSLCGKWGLGDAVEGAESGLPRAQGFDFFFGYLNQRHAHNYYPEFLWRNEEKVPLRNRVERTDGKKKKPYGGFPGGYAVERVDYSHDLVVDEAFEFVREHKNDPFFLFLALTIPHANNEGYRATGDGQEVPDYGIYAGRDWPNPDKGQAAMITRMDRDVGRLLDLLDELGLDEDTIVVFTSDNGPHDEGGHATERFDPGGGLRGMKRDLYEGGIRVPTIVRWPGHTPAGSESDLVAYQGDLLTTFAELAGIRPPGGLDSISLVPTITGSSSEQARHDYLYWEFHERGGAQAVRAGDWKAVRRPMHDGEAELFDLGSDRAESHDVAAANAEVVRRLEALMDEAHVPHPNWPTRK